MTICTPVTFRGRLWRWTKRLSLLTALLLVAAVPAAYFGAPALARHKKVHDRVQKALTQTFGTPVHVGVMTWSWKEGLTLDSVASASDLPGCSFAIEQVTLKPRIGKLLSGKLRFRAILESPEIVVVVSGTESREIRLPKFGKKGIPIDRVEIRNGSYILKSGIDDRTVRIDEITTEGRGRLQNRSLRLELTSLTGTYNGVKVSGKGVLRLSQDGFVGEVDLNGDAAKEPELRDALGAARVTIRKAPTLSEPF